MTSLEIRVLDAPQTVPTLQALCAATPFPLAEIRTAIQTRRPLLVAKLHGNDHEDEERRLLGLIDALDLAAVKYEIIIDGQLESQEYLRSILDSWQEIRRDTQMMTDLELGEPSIATLEWLKQRGPADVFRQTLKQIANEDGFNVDAETLAWVHGELGDS